MGQDVLRRPKVWFHDLFRRDGRPYIPAEVKYIREVTGANTGRLVNKRA